MDFVSLNRVQTARTKRQLASPSPSFRATPKRGRLTCNGRFGTCQGLNCDVKFGTHQAHIHGGSSMKSEFEPRTFRLRNQGLTRPPQS
ncbi:hypothetical protein AVEN_249605-1 [Araneus ventricosus]|uniref:Uncharacterized protein n=1 Tax=Araneus ventricosus TaxID=182803 RepID=A0A4Y2QKS5_ARAVE|nr:hypothetical protein AVEN_156819-1 [Araneus ventricosus]GBN63866.1 hypothetical protein AVEN_249605-1 [Araneus ventricosus]